MKITFQETKSTLFFCFWVICVIGISFLWFITLNYYLYEIALPLICGCVVGLLSGLSPPRSFLACFLAFFVMGIFGTFNPKDFLAFLTIFSFLGIFCGLIALICAVLRRVILRSRTEQLHLATWQWMIIMSGASIFADYLLIPDSYSAVIQFHFHQLFIEVLMAALTGFFCLGLYAGAFYDLEYRNLIKNVLKFSLGGHAVFLLYFAFHLATGHVFWKDSFFSIVIVIFLIMLIIGTRMGYRFRKNPQ
jgi:hypothetical protein